MAQVLRLLFLALVLALFAVGLRDFLSDVKENACEMTYMFEQPEFLKIGLDPNLAKTFPRYNLYLYGEGKYAEDLRNSNFSFTGIPVLFIPGNAGSYHQVRSLGSVAIRMTESTRSNFHFNFFALDLNEEFSGFFGPLLLTQTEFTHACIKHILTMYKGGPSGRASKPESVILVGHSIGGMVARALYTLPTFDRKTVQTIVTQATPHQAPVLSLDADLVDLYARVNDYWVQHGDEDGKLGDVTVFSTGGGPRDLMVRGGLTSLQRIVESDRSVSAVTVSVPRAWVSTDHLSHVSCKQTVLATMRAFFDIVDKKTKQVAVNPTYRVKPFVHHLDKNPGGTKQYKASHDIMINLLPTAIFEIRSKQTWKFVQPSVPRARYTAVRLLKALAPQYGYVAVTNVENVAWVGGCTIRPADKRCSQVGNFARYANLMPPIEAGLKAMHLDSYKLDMFEHWAVLLPESKTPVTMMFDLYKTADRHIVHNVTSFIDLCRGFPSSLTASDVVINATKSRNLFYNISLSGLTLPLQAYTASVVTKKCRANGSEGAEHAVVKFSVPWSGEHSYHVIPRGGSTRVPLKLASGRPDDYRGGNPELHLYLMPACSYRVSLDIAWTELAGQFFRFYAPCLPAYIVMQVLMALSWQLMALEEQGLAPTYTVAHARWAQPYRVCLVAAIFKFVISFPQGESFGVFIGMPPDDLDWLEKMSLYYPALPVLLYLLAYAAVGVYAYFAQLFVAGLGRVVSALFGGLRVRPSLVLGLEYIILLTGALAAGLLCGTIGIVAAYLLYLIKMLSSYARARNDPSQDVAKWTEYHVSFTLMLLLMLLACLNAPALLVWAESAFYWGTIRLTEDPSRGTGVIVCLCVAALNYAKFPYTKHELTSIMGAVTYFACVLMVLYTTTSVYRVSYFVCVILIAIAVPSLFLRFVTPSPKGQKPPTQAGRGQGAISKAERAGEGFSSNDMGNDAKQMQQGSRAKAKSE